MNRFRHSFTRDTMNVVVLLASVVKYSLCVEKLKDAAPRHTTNTTNAGVVCECVWGVFGGK